MTREITTVKDGQEFYDEPVYAMPKPISIITASVAKAFGSRLPRPVMTGRQRVRLRWLKPDGNGGLTPR